MKSLKCPKSQSFEQLSDYSCRSLKKVTWLKSCQFTCDLLRDTANNSIKVERESTSMSIKTRHDRNFETNVNSQRNQKWSFDDKSQLTAGESTLFHWTITFKWAVKIEVFKKRLLNLILFDKNHKHFLMILDSSPIARWLISVPSIYMIWVFPIH